VAFPDVRSINERNRIVPITKKPNGKYYAVLELEADGNGRRQRKSLGGHKTRRAAADAIAQATVARAEGRLAPTSRMTYSEWAEVRQKAQASEVRERSRAIYRQQRESHLVPEIGNHPLQRLTPALCKRATRPAALSLRSQRQLHFTLRSDLQAACDEGLLAVNPMDRIKAPSAKLAKEQSPRMMPYGASEAARALRLLEGHRLRAFVSLSLWLGWRRGEGLGTVWDDIDWDAKELRIHRQWTPEKIFAPTKSGRERTVELDDRSLAMLKAWKRQRTEEELAIGRHLSPESHIFANPDGSPPSPHAVSDAWRRLQRNWERDHGLRPRRLHDTRHSFATLALAAGANPVAVAAQIGDRVEIMLGTYAHVLPGEARGVSTAVANAIADAG
jgi:integrase